MKLPSISTGMKNNLTGPVLGAMPLGRYIAAGEACDRSRERLTTYQQSCYADGQTPDPVEEAKLRQQTRRELGPIMTPEEMEEFLLRSSHNAEALRLSLRSFEPTADEFRKIFRAIDPILHQMQLDYGSAAALSTKQREEMERICDRAVQEVLPSERFRLYVLTKDPTYQRAFGEAAILGVAKTDVMRLYEIYRDTQRKRDQIMQDARLDPQQRNQALAALVQEEQKKAQALSQRKLPRL